MSLQAMCAALRADLPTLEKFVLVAIANYADEEGKCWPSVARIAKDTGIGRSTVFRKLERLEQRGIVQRKNRTNDGMKLTTVYWIIPGKLDVPERDGVVPERDGGGPAAGRGVVPERDIEPVNIEPVIEPTNPPLIPPKGEARKKAPRKFVLKEDWQPSEKVVADLQEQGHSDEKIRRCRDDFVDWCISTGTGYVKHDLAFRKWVRNARERRSGNGAASAGHGGREHGRSDSLLGAALQFEAAQRVQDLGRSKPRDGLGTYRVVSDDE